MPLEGKKVLDYGCGTGEYSIVLAACGAKVTAFDLSPLSVVKARRRAELHGLADRIQFDVRKAGQTDYPQGSFDIVFGVGVLHHLHTILPAVFQEIARLLRPEGGAYFIEPMANSLLLRTLRRMIPLNRHATENERQLVYKDLKPLRAQFSSVRILHFYCLERLHRLCGGGARTQNFAVDRLSCAGSAPVPAEVLQRDSDYRSVMNHIPISAWSLHPGGGNWLFADGSVRFLPYASTAILPALATRSGGEVVYDDF